MTKLTSYLTGEWVSGTGPGATLVNPATEEALATASTEGLDFAKAVAHARTAGGKNLRVMTFAARAGILKALGTAINDARDELIGLSIANAGTTRSDSKFDIDGAASTLLYYADLGLKLGEVMQLVDGEAIALGRSARLYGQHVLVPRHGVAVHINAFNFPAWGMAEKAAVALLAGVPVISKPATATALPAHRIAELWVKTGALPAGAFSFVAGSVGSLLSNLSGQDVLAFTGSGATAESLRTQAGLARENVHFNVEADSLNAAVLGPDVEDGAETLNLFVTDVVKEITQKTGQKCTAIRRIYVPEAKLADIQERLVDRLKDVRVGNPADDKTTMGPVATAAQMKDVRAGIEKLSAGAEVAIGGPKAVGERGYFVAPTLLVRKSSKTTDAVNTLEVFGPVASLVGYARPEEAIEQIAAGGGGLVSSIYSDDKAFTETMLRGLAPYHGRLTVSSEKVAGQTIPPGTVMPQLLHGGPGRAGGGEELGGMRGMNLYLQRVAIQGHRALLEQIFAPPKPA